MQCLRAEECTPPPPAPPLTSAPTLQSKQVKEELEAVVHACNYLALKYLAADDHMAAVGESARVHICTYGCQRSSAGPVSDPCHPRPREIFLRHSLHVEGCGAQKVLLGKRLMGVCGGERERV